MSKIEWTEKTWNPMTGCTKVSPGCKNCYAEDLAKRLKAMGVKGYEKGFELTTHPSRLDYPKNIRKPTMFFVNSMSDLFHEDLPVSFISKVMYVMHDTPRHTYQILTKRPENLITYFLVGRYPPPQNAWIGVSAENRKHGIPRIKLLKEIPAAVRFLSVEPLLEDLGDLDLSGIDWVIVGGESGPKARPMKWEWAANIMNQCNEQNVPFFFKQWGAWGQDGKRRSKKANGRRLLGMEYNEMPRPEDRTTIHKDRFMDIDATKKNIFHFISCHLLKEHKRRHHE